MFDNSIYNDCNLIILIQHVYEGFGAEGPKGGTKGLIHMLDKNKA